MAKDPEPAKARLSPSYEDHLDAQGDLAPPWEVFPSYARYTIGWRMGAGESWLSLWGAFLRERLEPTFQARLAYLRRHPPAPFTWGGSVYRVLYPDCIDPDTLEEGEEEITLNARRQELVDRGLIAPDASYVTWLGQQRGVITWPWEGSPSRGPEEEARHRTRELWFWSRQLEMVRARAGWEPPQVPAHWAACEEAIATGQTGPLDLSRGLLSLAIMLSAGDLLPPWKVGLSLGDFKDSFEPDMGYVDAYRSWVMDAFDDPLVYGVHLAEHAPSEPWRVWLEEHVGINVLTPYD